jgi:hypothetical protein
MLCFCPSGKAAGPSRILKVDDDKREEIERQPPQTILPPAKSRGIGALAVPACFEAEVSE